MVKEWNASVEISEQELLVLKLCNKQKLWGFLRKHRHEIFDDEVREALAKMYVDNKAGGRPALAPERLALAMLLQVGFGVSDQEVPTLTVVDRRWQMILDCPGISDPLFSQGTVFAFRERARTNGLMSLLLNKTVALAREHQGFSDKHLRAIFDSSPLTGAGRVEDTFNLLGRAIAELLEVSCSEGSFDARVIAHELEISVASATSVKAVLDVDWREPTARAAALQTLLAQLERLRSWLSKHFDEKALKCPPIADCIETVERVLAQDTEPDPKTPGPSSKRRIRDGVAKDRLISLSDRDMRHGRKSKKKTFNGYKRHVAVDADVQGLICAVQVQAANVREHDAAEPLMKSIKDSGYELHELQIDRGYLPAAVVVKKHSEGLKIISKPPTPRRNEYFAKDAFAIDFEKATVTCPAGTSVPLKLAQTVTFPISACGDCGQKAQCTKSRQRHLSIHPQELWYREMAHELSTEDGRALRRERTQVEHALARTSAIQGNRARFRGLKKNQFDLQRVAVVNNCYVLERGWPTAA